MKELISNEQLTKAADLPNGYTDPEFETALRTAVPKLFGFFLSFIKEKDAALILIHNVLRQLWANRNRMTVTTDLDACIFESAKTEVLAYLSKK